MFERLLMYDFGYTCKIQVIDVNTLDSILYKQYHDRNNCNLVIFYSNKFGSESNPMIRTN